ncbi:hypothetical protein FA95DRAFT_1135420 [Auriscalpium vulgare]|uniref:Uncharacterized protein n=1 Tax=Auriscalpium vulgare TaxID=40419 RepID=A0ACB8RVE0_9AGAM|nr:hypothetical protein FA95DRAFT_1135420 [Auriscalpium vulgare]
MRPPRPTLARIHYVRPGLLPVQCHPLPARRQYSILQALTHSWPFLVTCARNRKSLPPRASLFFAPSYVTTVRAGENIRVRRVRHTLA